MNRLFRLLPLASLVLTACSLHTPQGHGKSRIRRSGASTSRLSAASISSRPAGVCLSSDEQKVYARFFWQQTGGTAIACC